jgi:hypothetical protein
MSVIMTRKNDVSYQNGWLPKKMSETNKNVTKMGVILKGVYYIDLRKFIVKN